VDGDVAADDDRQFPRLHADLAGDELSAPDRDRWFRE
jgi:hypothetical protein